MRLYTFGIYIIPERSDHKWTALSIDGNTPNMYLRCICGPITHTHTMKAVCVDMSKM